MTARMRWMRDIVAKLNRRQRCAQGKNLGDDLARRFGPDLCAPIAQRGGRIVVNFHEETVRSRGRCSASERPSKLRRPARLFPFATGLLHRVCDVVNDRRTESAKDRKGSHVDDEILIAE